MASVFDEIAPRRWNHFIAWRVVNAVNRTKQAVVFEERTELLGDNATPIERHLIETIVASWLQLRVRNDEPATHARATFFDAQNHDVLRWVSGDGISTPL